MTNYDMDEIERKRDKEKRESEEPISDWVDEQGELWGDIIRLEPKRYFDKCIIGISVRVNLHCLCYDTGKILTMLQEDMGMTNEEATDHFFFNVEGSYLGEHSPVFLNRHFMGD